MKNNRIVLLRPPTVMKGTSFIATQFPLNLASIAASLLAKGYEVDIWDFDVESLEERELIRKIRLFDPFIAGISCYTPTVINGHAIAAIIKKHMPHITTVVGGHHVSALPAETIGEFESFDMGVIGEGEETMAELADKISKGDPIENVGGIVYRKGGRIFTVSRREPIENLDHLPFPARHLLNISRYKGQSHRGFSRSFLKITEIITSRGCPNRCIFCASDITMGKAVRFRSADSVKGEIEECCSRFGFNHFTISDDTFTLKEERLYDICDEFARRKVTWNCNARVHPISKKMLEVMARSGCSGITFGVESGSPRILRLIKKNVTLEQMESAFKRSREAGIKLVEADIIIGSHPSEDEHDIELTKRFLRKISPDIIMVSILVPYPGTEIYGMMQDRHLIENNRKWDDFVLFGKKPSWRTDNFSPEKLVMLQRKIMASFYFRPLYIFRMILKIRTVKELIYYVKGGMDFIVSCAKCQQQKRRTARHGVL